MRGWGVLAIVVTGSLAACGSSGSEGSSSGGSSGSAGVASGGAPSGGSGGASSGGASSGGASGGSAGSGADAGDGGPFVTDAGMFLCGGCACDGATHYCVSIAAGVRPPPPPDAGVCPDVTSPGAEGCHPLPGECKGVPSCGCLPSPMPGYGACYCTDSGGGLTYGCALP